MHSHSPPLTRRKATITQTTHHIAHDLAGTVALLQRQSAQHVDGKEEYHEIRAEPRRKPRSIELNHVRRLADVHRKLGCIVLQIGHDRGLRKTGAP